MFKAAKLADEGEPEVEEQLQVQHDDGHMVAYADLVEEIQLYLQQHGSEVTLDEVRQHTGFDVRQPGVLEALRCNPRIEAINLATGERLKYRPPFGVRNRGSLAHMLSRAYPGSGEIEAVLRSELRAEETYDGLDVDLDELLAQNACVRINVNDNKRAREFVLFAAPEGAPLPEEVREMWRAERVPAGPALQEAVLDRKLRTKQEIEERGEHRAEERRKAQELAAQPKQNKGKRIRKWNNTHLGDADELEALTGTGR